MKIGKLNVDSRGRLTGICPNGRAPTWNNPFPCVNGTPGGMSVPHGVLGVLMHTMVSDLGSCVEVFNRPGFEASAHFGVSEQGEIHQFGPVTGWKAWHAMSANDQYYGIEHADGGDPNRPLTAQQIAASAQLVEVLSRVGNFPLQITNTPGGEGYGVHFMGGASFGGHSCPDLPPHHVRSAQRPAILKLAQQIRAGTSPTPQPSVRTWTTAGQMTFASLCQSELKELPSTVLRVTLQNSVPVGAFGPLLVSYLNAVFTADTQLAPAGTTWTYPGGEWTAEGQLSLAALCQQHLEALPAQVLALTATHSRDDAYEPDVASYINSVIGRSTLKPPVGTVFHY